MEASMKKVVSLFLALALASSSSFALDLFGNSSSSTPQPPKEFISQSYLTMLDGQKSQIQSLLLLSQQLKEITQSYLDNFTQLNETYIKAMLRLSDDIGKMADRIGEMADRIVYTEVLIGEMADRIVVVAKEIIDFCSQTQKNLLQAQKNLNDLLIKLKN